MNKLNSLDYFIFDKSKDSSPAQPAMSHRALRARRF